MEVNDIYRYHGYQDIDWLRKVKGCAVAERELKVSYMLFRLTSKKLQETDQQKAKKADKQKASRN